MNWWVAFTGMVAGALAGDVCLYLTGRYATSFLLSRRWMDPDRLVRVEGYFKNHAVLTIFLSRFLPGVRGVGFSVSGIVRYPFPRFLLILTAAAMIQAWIFLRLGDFIGDRILPMLKDKGDRLAAIATVVLVGAVAHQIFAHRRKKKAIKAKKIAVTIETDTPNTETSPSVPEKEAEEAKET